MQRPIFHEPWWLDAVAPGSWTEVTVDVDGETRALLPFSTRRMGPGIIVLGAPPLTPYLGPLTVPGDGKPATRLKRDRELQSALLEQLPRHDVYKTTLTLDHRNWPVLAEHGFVGSPRVTYVIDELDDADRIWSGFGDSTRRAVRKAEKRLTVRVESDVASLLPMAAATFDRQSLDLPYSPDVLERAAAAAIERDRGRVLTAVDEDDAVHASMLVVWDDDRAYYLVGGADPSRRESAALSLLMWEAIKMSAAHTRRFDFEGSMVPGVERFFRGFGGTQYSYLGVMRFSRRGRIGWTGYQLLQAIRGR